MTRKYSSTSITTSLSTAISASAASMTVVTGTGSALLGGITLAAGNVDQFTLAIDADTVNEEIVFATQISTDTVTIVRGQAGTTATVHSAGASIKHVLTSDDLDYFKNGILTDKITSKGDIVAGTGSGTFSKLGIGTNGQYLVADSTQTTGLKWSTFTTSVTDSNPQIFMLMGA
jgi:hypothetical protein